MKNAKFSQSTQTHIKDGHINNRVIPICRKTTQSDRHGYRLLSTSEGSPAANWSTHPMPAFGKLKQILNENGRVYHQADLKQLPLSRKEVTMAQKRSTTRTVPYRTSYSNINIKQNCVNITNKHSELNSNKFMSTTSLSNNNKISPLLKNSFLHHQVDRKFPKREIYHKINVEHELTYNESNKPDKMSTTTNNDLDVLECSPLHHLTNSESLFKDVSLSCPNTKPSRYITKCTTLSPSMSSTESPRSHVIRYVSSSSMTQSIVTSSYSRAENNVPLHHLHEENKSVGKENINNIDVYANNYLKEPSPDVVENCTSNIRNPNYSPTKPYTVLINSNSEPVMTQSTVVNVIPVVRNIVKISRPTASCVLSSSRPSTNTPQITSLQTKSALCTKSLHKLKPQRQSSLLSHKTSDLFTPEKPVEADSSFPKNDDESLGDGEMSCGDNTEDDSHNYSLEDSESNSNASLSSKKSGALLLKGDELNIDKIPKDQSNEIVLPALTSSLFSNVPPTIKFVKEGEKVTKLPWEERKLLKWRLSPITPNIVKSCLARVGFRVTKKSYDWLGCWGKQMKSPIFKTLRDYQKINHFPGTFQLGRKDRLWRNLRKMQFLHGRKEFNFFPQTYVLPYDMKMLKRAWDEHSTHHKWIVKPPASARGMGIRVIHKWNQLPRHKPIIVQRYLSKPFLICESKFDMRLYVYVSCYEPLRIYIFNDGLARFASCKYSSSLKNLSNQYMHLTNYSINKNNSEYKENNDDHACQGHKWSLKSLWAYLRQVGVNTNILWESIKELIIKTIISAETHIIGLMSSNIRCRYTVHELFGFDILLDENLKPWILEVNISPSLHSNSALDLNIKGQMIKDLFNLCGFHIPDRKDLISDSCSNIDISKYEPSSRNCFDRRLYVTQLVPDEKSKHSYYVTHHNTEKVQTILDVLTPSDVRILTESIDEDSRKGQFQRIFPTPTSHKYLKYFEQPRYFNLLLDEWITRYNQCEVKGIQLLEKFCREKLHLDMSVNHPHQWSITMVNRLQSTSSTSLFNYGTNAVSSSTTAPDARKKEEHDSPSKSHSSNIVRHSPSVNASRKDR